jgi:hypothetical protein
LKCVTQRMPTTEILPVFLSTQQNAKRTIS